MFSVSGFKLETRRSQ